MRRNSGVVLQVGVFTVRGSSVVQAAVVVQEAFPDYRKGNAEGGHSPTRPPP